MSIDAIGNFLTIIRNGLMNSSPFVVVPFSNMRNEITQILKEEGFIKNFTILNEDELTQKSIKIFLKYVDGESAIHEIKRISRPGRRMYAGIKNVKPVIGGLGLSILTTNKGVITHKKAKELGLGGEVLCTIW
jgi:small subunit ribosomal protein S8